MSSILLALRLFYYNYISKSTLKSTIKHFVTETLPRYEELINKYGPDGAMLIFSPQGEIEIWITIDVCREILDLHNNQRFYVMRKKYFPENYSGITNHLYRYDQIATLPSKAERRGVRKRWTNRMKTKLRPPPP